MLSAYDVIFDNWVNTPNVATPAPSHKPTRRPTPLPGAPTLMPSVVYDKYKFEATQVRCCCDILNLGVCYLL